MSIDSRRVAIEQRPVEVRDQQSRVGVVTHATISVMESYLSEMCLTLRDDPRVTVRTKGDPDPDGREG
jgi:hypothetical protein